MELSNDLLTRLPSNAHDRPSLPCATPIAVPTIHKGPRPVTNPSLPHQSGAALGDRAANKPRPKAATAATAVESAPMEAE